MSSNDTSAVLLELSSILTEKAEKLRDLAAHRSNSLSLSPSSSFSEREGE